MKLATTTGDFDIFSNSYLDKIRYVHEAGFKYIDLCVYDIFENDPLILADNWQNYAEKILKYAEDSGIEFVQCHSPNLNPRANEEEFEKAVTWNTRAIEVCAKLGIPNMVVHGGCCGKDDSKSDFFTENKRFYEKLFPAMEKYNVCVLHENGTKANTPGFVPRTGADMKEFSEYVNHPLFHACWDTGHANIEGPQYNELLTMGDDLRGLHINDNRGFQDEHIIPYLGTLNMDDIMNGLIDINYKGYFTFESGSALRPSKYWLGNRHEFSKDTRLQEPSLELQKELEKFMYSVGKHILSAYDLFEE